MNTSGSRRWWVLGALVLSGLVVGIDVNVLNIALPTLASSLKASTADLQWFVTAYTLVGAAALLPAGMLGDRFGRKKLLSAALLLFGVASIACAYAPSASSLIGARGALGLAAAFILPLSVGVLPVLFSAEERPRAVAIVASSSMAALPIGPIVGGWLLTNFWWGSVFLINVPVVALALIAVFVLMPETSSSVRSSIDVVGVASSSASLGSLVYGVIQAGENGWGDSSALAPLIVGGALLVAFVLWERHVAGQVDRQPLVDLGLFRSPSFLWGTVLGTLVTFTMFGVSFTVPQFFQAIRGTDAMGVGLRMIPMVIGLVGGLAIADRVARRAGAKVTVAVGFAVLAVGLLSGSTTSAGSGDAFVLGWVSVMGFGLGFALPTAMNAALGALSKERAGAGSALIMAVRQVGGAFGVAILGSVLNTAYRGHLDLAGLPADAAATVQKSAFAGTAVARQIGSSALLASVRGSFVAGMDSLLVVCAGIALAGAMIAFALLPVATRAARTEPAGGVLVPVPETVD